ncbi:MAG: hypothetical protein JNM86_05350 [Phycisphaerae bacterium]|nr:hypothetical protein [Phycisphaerae bacterium]
MRTCVAIVAGLAFGGSSALALVNPFTEHFESAACNWSIGAALTPPTYFASGGVDGGSYAGRSFSLAGNNIGATPILFRAQSNFNSSGNAFVGNWITGGVTKLQFSLRHNMDVPVTFFARISPDPVTSPNPGGVIALTSAVAGNQWATFTVDIGPGSPFIYEGTTFNAVFSAVARLQFGVFVDAGTANKVGPFAFDIDNVSIIPATGTLSIAGAGLVLVSRRRRR